MGTSVTSTMISLANLSNLEQFRLGFSAATIHDLFNWCSILLLLPVEMGTGLLENISGTERFLLSSGTYVDILQGAIVRAIQRTGIATSEDSFLFSFHSLFAPIIDSLVVLKSQGKS